MRAAQRATGTRTVLATGTSIATGTRVVTSNTGLLDARKRRIGVKVVERRRETERDRDSRARGETAGFRGDAREHGHGAWRQRRGG